MDQPIYHDFTIREIIGLVVWWCEGTKFRRDFRWKNAITYPVEVTNTDPEIIRLFISFLEREFKVKKSALKIQIQIHEGDNKEGLYYENSGLQPVFSV